MDSTTENNRHDLRMMVRVKKCGKSAQLYAAMYKGGKPYLEQDKAARTVVCSDLNVWVCRIDKWLLLYESKDRIRLIVYHVLAFLTIQRSSQLWHTLQALFLLALFGFCPS